jgi:hypothetical protein
MLQKYLLFSLFTLLFQFYCWSQEVYEHVSNENIYNFLDELAISRIIDINSVVKPYSRDYIARKLLEVRGNSGQLDKRQLKELNFYLNALKLEVDSIPDFKKLNIFKKKKTLATSINPLGLFYKDKLFTFSIKPIWGINYFVSDKGSVYHRWGGAEGYAYIGSHWGLYANLRDNSESKMISNPDYFTMREGGGYKPTAGGGGDFSEMRGGITYSWDWGSIGIVKDHLNWGNGNHGVIIFTDRAPSISQIKFHIKPVKWFEVNYYHGWLVSMVIDSVRSYIYPSGDTTDLREVYRPKYIAANIYTFTPWKRLNISFGNSIVYSDMSVHPAYLIPFLFYKSIDHTLNNEIDNQNSQMFFDISSRQIKHLHLFGTLYIDELKVERITNDTLHNFWSLKLGTKISNLWVNNVSVTAEYTMSMPITYEHRVPTLTYESNNYNCGFYLIDNSQEYYLSVAYKPIRGLRFKVSYLLAQHGPDYDYTLDHTVDTHPFMERLTWQNQTISFKATYEFISNSYLFFEFMNSNITGDEEQVIKYTPEYFRGQNNIISAGFNIGF